MKKIGNIFFFILAYNQNLYSQSIQNYYTKEDGICGQNITLFSNNTFSFNSTCEIHPSDFFIGNWRKDSNTITLTPYKNIKFKVIKNVISKKNKSNNLEIEFFDVNGKNISNKLELLINKKDSNYFFKLSELDSKFVIDKFYGKKIILSNLQNLFKKKLEIIIQPGRNKYKIFLNINKDWGFNISSIWADYGDINFRVFFEKLIPINFDRNKGVLFYEFNKIK